MKKTIVFCMAVLLVFGLAACGASEESISVVPSSSSTPPIPTGKPELPPVFTYSPYAITTFSKEAMGEDYDLYCDLVDAVLNYDCEISGFEDENQFVGLWSTLRQEFPPAKVLCADFLNSKEPYIYADGTVRLEFRMNEEEHNEILNAYAQRMQKDLSTLTVEDTEVERISKLYGLVTRTMAYEKTDGTLYDNIMANKGVSDDYAEYLILLLNQVGVECYYAVSYGEGVEAHAWVVAKMDGEFYHFDPTWQKDFVDGFWFAIDDELRRDSLLTEWKYAYLAGADWESVKGDHVTMESRLCWLTHEKIPLPACPAAYQTES